VRTWRNTVVRFGLLSVPVALSPLVKDKGEEGHRYDVATGERVRQAWTVDGKSIVPNDETETRYDVPDGDPVAVAVAISGTTGIDIEAAVHIGDVDASLFASSYACNPSKDSPRSLATLARVLQESGRILVGRARFTESASERSVVLRYSPLTKGVVLETLAPLERVRIQEARDAVGDETPSAAEIAQGTTFLDSLPDVLPTLLVADERDEIIRASVSAHAAGDMPGEWTDEDVASTVADFVQSGYDEARARKEAEEIGSESEEALA
jgi:non-homologous end joining protein Ku